MLQRTANCEKKLERMNKTLAHKEADRVPISDIFWSSFVKNWRRHFGLADDTDIYKYYDLDWIVTIPNIDPHIKQFEIIKDDDEEVIVKTGFECTIRKKFDDPMPAFLKFDIDDIDQALAMEFDDAWDERRYYKSGDNQLAGVGDVFTRNLPAWTDTIKSLYPDIPVYGSVCEVQEFLWRIVGSENVLMWLGLYPDKMKKLTEKIQRFMVETAKAQIKAGNGLLAGMVIWGDVAYTRTMMFSPEMWRQYFKPCVNELIDLFHDNGLPVIYHGCGNVKSILGDFAEMGLNAYNPLEAKAGLDVIDLRKELGHTLGFCGNMDVQLWARADEKELKDTVMRKLNAAKGGGFIFQSDHSIPGNIPPQNYDYVVKLVHEKGVYPLDLGEYDIPDIS